MNHTEDAGPVAVVDIGSNSIKLLVAGRAADGSLVELAQETEETRIGSGITGNPPRLDESAMERAIDSIRKLLCTANRFSPAIVRIVATSAVRDAANQADFLARVDDATNHSVDVLPGPEEARLVAQGIREDPALNGTATFYLFDLGGGSLEMLAWCEHALTQLVSVPLGCVRVTEACVPRPHEPLDPATQERIKTLVREVVSASGFRFELPRSTIAIVTGGTATTVRAIRAAAAGRSLLEQNGELTLAELALLTQSVAAAPLEARLQRRGLSRQRADVFPAALITLLEVAQLAGVERFQHSLYGLRYGVAAELLDRRDRGRK